MEQKREECTWLDLFMEEGFNYFDTAHGYLEGKSEIAIGKCLASRYPRESYRLTNKLTGNFFEKEEDIRPFFEEQLKTTKVSYFDYYLMHAQDREKYQHFQKCHAYEIAQQLKKEGKVKHVGISFHDSAEVLEKILKEHPEIEVVQIQFNYMDFNNASVQGKKVYEICRKYKKPVIVMEPLRGGALANLPKDAKTIFDSLETKASYASYAIRYATSFEGMFMVLSGMSNLEQVKDNISFMKEFKPLQKNEQEAIQKVTNILKELGGIPCTACKYCVEGCPKKISIPDLFGCYNAKKQFNDWNSDFYYKIHTKTSGKASDCIGCGQCEKNCPQHIKIIEHLKEVAKVFETK